MKCTEPGCTRSGLKNKQALFMHIQRAHRGLDPLTSPEEETPLAEATSHEDEPNLLPQPQATRVGELVRRDGRVSAKVINGITIPTMKRTGTQGQRMTCPVPGCGHEAAISYMGNHLRDHHGIYRRKTYKTRTGKLVGHQKVNGHQVPPPPVEALPPASEQHYAMKMQALIQLAELIVKL